MGDTLVGLSLAFVGSSVLIFAPHRRGWDMLGSVLIVAGLFWIVAAVAAAGEVPG